jgi:DNA-binding XRE family transcriptional regulator
LLSERRRDHNAETIGALIKAAREKAGLTQKAVADAVGLNYYTMISQMELGYVTVPPALWVKLPDVLGMDRQDFVLRCLAAHQPQVYQALFGNKGRQEVADALRTLTKG